MRGSLRARQAIDKRFLLALLLTSASTIPCLARAQTVAQPSVIQPPIYEAVDENGVDLLSGQLDLDFATISIGSGQPGTLSFTAGTKAEYNASVEYFTGYPNASATVIIGGRTETFAGPNTLGAGAFTAEQGRPVTLEYLTSTSQFRYTDKAGTEYTFEQDPVYSSHYSVTTIRSANGATLTYTYEAGVTREGWVSLRSIGSSAGYQMHFDYITTGNTKKLAKVTLLNTKVESCAPDAEQCANLSSSWPSLAWDNSDHITDQSGRTVTIGSTAVTPSVFDTRISSVTTPQGRQKTFTWTSTPEGPKVASVTNGGGTWSYGWNPDPYVRSVQVTGPGGYSKLLYISNSIGQPVAEDITGGGYQHFEYDEFGRLAGLDATYVAIFYSYDQRGNVVRMEAGKNEHPDFTSALVTTATFEPNCTNTKICNKPTSTTVNGNTTEYSYDANHGGLTIITQASPGSGKPRPQTRFDYTPFDSDGNVSAGGVYMQTGISTCLAGDAAAGCVGTSDEARRTLTIGPNLQTVATTSSAGDNSLVTTTNYNHDGVGNVVAIDGPLPGPQDTRRYRFDTLRQTTGVIEPDPDGAGPLPSLATKIAYDMDGLPTVTSRGTVADASDVSWSSFSQNESIAVQYDAFGRKVAQRMLDASDTTVALRQYGYDERGLVTCEAERLNTSIFASPPPCETLTSSASGDDRISSFGYDGPGRIIRRTDAVGTPQQSDTATMVWEPDSRLASVTDGEGNKTIYGYDVLRRRVTTTYPSAAKGSGTSNDADFEQITFDANGNVVQRRLRDGNLIGYSYDALNRLTFKDRPDISHNPDIAYTYNNLGQLTSAGGSWGTLTLGYDALGRQTSENHPSLGTTSWGYDAAGRRTRTTWADGFYVDYNYRPTGDLLSIVEQGGFTLAAFGYDNLGRRTTLSRGNGTATNYGYDTVSRLTSLTQDLSGTVSDLTQTFSYNSASQITSRSSSNDSYAWSDHYNVDRAYSANGLNQLTTSGSTVLGYDPRGNLTSSGSTTYGYTADNQLFRSAAGDMVYDPLERLLHIGPEANLLRYEGMNQIAEYDSGSGALRRRYVYGSAPDEVLVQYEGAGVADRRWLHADERGSIVAVSGGDGNAVAINRYDEYGIPQSTNQGRFQYTGQAWIPSLGLYHYKARAYSPTLGRFMQTDPIGYADGMNIYGYVGNDPINATDPTGLEASLADIVVIGQRENQICLGTGCDYVRPSDSGFNLLPAIGDPPTPGQARQSPKQCPLDANPSRNFMHKTTNNALRSVPGGGRSGPLSTEFARITQLPDFRSGGWSSVGSLHARQSFEHSLPGSDRVVKVYISDSNFNGANTVTISSPTSSVEHYAEVLPYAAGYPVNTGNANDYWKDKLGCQ